MTPCHCKAPGCSGCAMKTARFQPSVRACATRNRLASSRRALAAVWGESLPKARAPPPQTRRKEHYSMPDTRRRQGVRPLLTRGRLRTGRAAPPFHTPPAFVFACFSRARATFVAHCNVVPRMCTCTRSATLKSRSCRQADPHDQARTIRTTRPARTHTRSTLVARRPPDRYPRSRTEETRVGYRR